MRQSFIITLALLLSIVCNGQSLIPIDTIYINRNDKLFFEAKIDSSNHLAFVRGSKHSDKSNTLSISCKYTDATGTMLEINNPFERQLLYKAGLYSLKKEAYVETSIMPVYPKSSSFETWPFEIDKIRLTGFRLIETSQNAKQ